MNENNVVVVDQLVADGARLEAWTANGSKCAILSRGRRFIVLAPPGNTVVTAAIPPVSLASDQWVQWYSETSGSMPQVWAVGRGRVTRLAEAVPEAVVLAAGEQAAGSWLAAGADVAHTALERRHEEEAPLVMEAGTPQGHEEEEDDEGVIVGDTEPAGETAKELAGPTETQEEMKEDTPTPKNALVLPDEPDAIIEIVPAGDGQVVRERGRSIGIPGSSGGFMVVRMEEAKSEARICVLRDGQWVEDKIAFMAAARAAKINSALTTNAQAAVAEEYRKRTANFRKSAVDASMVRNETERRGSAPEGITGQDGTCYAQAGGITGELTNVRGTGEAAPKRVVVLEEANGNRTLYLPVEAGYVIESSEGKRHMAVYGDGSLRNLTPEGAKRLEIEATVLEIRTMSIARTPATRAAEAIPIMTSPAGGNTDVGETTETTSHEPKASHGPPAEENYSEHESFSDGPPPWESDNQWGEEEDGPPPWEGEETPDFSEPAPKARAPRARTASPKPGATSPEISGPARGMREGRINIANWAQTPPQGWDWAAGCAMACADSEDELDKLGCLTPIRLLRKGFPLSHSDKTTIDAALKREFRARAERVKIYTIGGGDYFARSLPDGTGRYIGPGLQEVSAEVAEKIREAARREDGGVESIPKPSGGRGRGGTAA